MDSFHIRHKLTLVCEGGSCTMTFDIDLYPQGHSSNKTARYTAHLYLDGFIPYLAQMNTSIGGFVVCSDLRSWSISSSSFSHDSAIKPLKYDMFSRVRFTAGTVLDGFFPFSAQMITTMRRCSRAWWPLTLTYIFKVIQLLLCNEIAKICHILLCRLYNTYSSGWILSKFGANDH